MGNPAFQTSLASPETINLGKDDVEALFPIVTRIELMMEEHRRKHTGLLQGVVAINGAAPTVGKTWVSCRLIQLLHKKRIATGSMGGCIDEDNTPTMMVRMDQNAEFYSYTNGLILFNAIDDCSFRRKGDVGKIRSHFDRLITELTAAYRPPILWIGIDRPNNQFSEKYVLADFLIHNIGAKDR